MEVVAKVASDVAIEVSVDGEKAVSAGPGIPEAKECVVCIGKNFCIGEVTETFVLKAFLPKVGVVSKNVAKQARP